MPKIKKTEDLADIQQKTEGFPKREIKKVGIRGVQVPLKVIRKNKTINHCSGEISVYTNLNDKVKGANMSRYRIVVEEYLINKDLNLREYIRELLKATRERLDATDSYVKIKFDYFLINKAPASKLKSYMNYKCCIEGKQKIGVPNISTRSIQTPRVLEEIILTVQVPYTSCCPCSKEISDYGAHNQRSFAEVKVELINNEILWIEDIVDIVESCASAPIINTLKRNDEAFQTELMYENPRFVEDMSRLIGEKLDKHLDVQISDYVVVIEHQESIHTYDAISVLTAGRELQ